MFQTKFLSQDVQMPQYLQQPSQVIKHFLDIKKKIPILTAVYQQVESLMKSSCFKPMIFVPFICSGDKCKWTQKMYHRRKEKKRPKSEITPMFDTKYASNFHRI